MFNQPATAHATGKKPQRLQRVVDPNGSPPALRRGEPRHDAGLAGFKHIKAVKKHKQQAAQQGNAGCSTYL